MFDTEDELVSKTVFALQNNSNLDKLLENALLSAQQFSSHTFAKNVEALYKNLLINPEAFKAEPFEPKVNRLPKKVRLIRNTEKRIKRLAKRPAAIIKRYIKTHEK